MSNVPALLLSALVVISSSSAPARRQNPPPQEQPARAEPDLGRPLRWLLRALGDDGGWGTAAGAPADVATTSLSGLALLRLGHTPVKGEYQAASRKALGYVIRAVERAPGPTQYIQDEGTQPQRKLGPGDRHLPRRPVPR